MYLADDSESWLMRGEYEMELCSAAEAAGNLAGALSHVNKAVGMSVQQLHHCWSEMTCICSAITNCCCTMSYYHVYETNKHSLSVFFRCLVKVGVLRGTVICFYCAMLRRARLWDRILSVCLSVRPSVCPSVCDVAVCF